MKNNKPTSTLRGLAEQRLRKKDPSAGPSNRIEADAKRLVHELQVHQIELELQNAELVAARDRMELMLEKYTDLFDFAPVGYFSLDEAGVILEVNLTGAAMLGVERSRLINRRLSGFVAPANQPAFMTFLKQIFTGNGKQDCEAALEKANAAVFHARLRGTLALAISGPRKWCRVSVSDITALKQADDILRRNEVLFSALIQQAPMGVYVVDDQLRLQQVNAKARPVFSKVHPMLGRDLAEIMNILWPAKTAAEVMVHFRNTLNTGQPYVSPAFTERRRDIGVKESYEWQLQRITLPAGRHGVVCFFSNITARKRTEATERRVAVLAASNQKLEAEIVRRMAGEKALKQSERQLNRSLQEARHQQEQLRHLSRKILKTQEEERKRISRELHDEVAQTLVGMNVHLESLAREATINPDRLKQKIVRTQQLVEKSVDVVHRFARDLRPTLLDDLGLIPALHSYLKEFTERTKVRVHFKAFSGVERLSDHRRLVIYRVTQSALTNIAQHAHATDVKISLQKIDNTALLEIHDNGKSFDVERVLFAKRYKRLGLLGTRERVEMIGGSFNIESAPGKGTTIRAQIPFSFARKTEKAAPGKKA